MFMLSLSDVIREVNKKMDIYVYAGLVKQSVSSRIRFSLPSLMKSCAMKIKPVCTFTTTVRFLQLKINNL